MDGALIAVRRSWGLSPELHEFKAPAPSALLDDFEQRAGWRLPEVWRELYRLSNGAGLLEGNVNLYPLSGDDYSVLEASRLLRSHDWPIPERLWVVGDNGQGDLFGIWVGSDGRVREQVIALAQLFEDRCMAIAASTPSSFLLGRTAYYSLLIGVSPAALDTLAVPQEFRDAEPDDELWQAVTAWADPDRPDLSADPYEARLDEHAVARLVGDPG